MRREKQKLTAEECREILINEPRGVLGLNGDDNYPYTIPMNYVYDNGKIYFHGAKEGYKIDILKNNNKVSFCVLDKGHKNKDNWWYVFKSVIIFGKIKILSNNDEKLEKLEKLGDKLFPSHEVTENEIKKYFAKTEVFELTPDHISGKKVIEK